MIVLIWGSSPLTRGKRPYQVPFQIRLGLIPAHAGKTATRWVAACARRAHPRSRGENVRLSHSAVNGAGSSPLTRGKRSSTILTHRTRRLIPAHAGKTARMMARGRRAGAHPRSRGENVTVLPQQSSQPGSSPLTRGKLKHDTPLNEAPRLIPAHAGKTYLHYTSGTMYRAHPRSRGENAHSSM